ncbi:hypothetical protein CI610_01368 [invertebrate metagenome]|uniref:DUF5681 domain-containing protein n=1 Tax=invertebrate metagenome TaxID=1711999 RepID=A0A2H9T8W7_9ZZZZ
MNNHGGARIGSGRPKGGMSHIKRLLVKAITDGLAHAGSIQHPELMNGCDKEEQATKTATMIISDMVRSGQANDVIKILSLMATKETDTESNVKNTLANALSKLPQPGNNDRNLTSQVADMSQNPNEKMNSVDFIGIEDNRPSNGNLDGREKQPFFSPQNSLLLDNAE